MATATESPSKKKSRRWLLWSLGLLVCLCGAGAVALFGSKPGTLPPATGTAVVMAATDVPTAMPTMIVDPRVAFEAAVRDALGTGNRNIPRLTEMKFDEFAAGEISLVWAINQGWDQDGIKRGAKRDAAAILHALALSGLSYSDIIMTGSYAMGDAFGNVTERNVITLTFDRSTVDKIDWDGFETDNVYQIADSSAIWPQFRDP